MLSVTQLPDGRTKVRMNSSSLSILQECWRKAKYLIVDQWASQTENPATIYGSAIHKAMEVFYLGDPAERIFPFQYREKFELMAHGTRYSDEEDLLLLRSVRAFLDAAEPLKSLPETDKRSMQTGIYLLENYFKTYLDDPLTALRDPAGIPYVERDFSFVAHEDSTHVIEWFGRIDLILENKSTGTIFVTDHKTTSVIGSDFYARLKPNAQYTGYLMGARKALGIDTDSFLVNGLQVKPKPLTSRGTPPHLIRQVTTRDELDYKEFTTLITDYASEFLRRCKTDQFPLGGVNACSMYGGCGLLNICSSPSSLRNNVLRARFSKEIM